MLNGVLPILMMAAILRPVVMDNTDGAGLAFARYLAHLNRVSSWSSETIEIDASLPKLRESAHLRAIRRLSPAGGADYEVLELTGDRTVRQQVIERYLNAQVTAAEIPAASVAITPVNYEFSYRGAVGTAYAFHIKPRRKRTGLISGELWLDGETGAAVRQAGRLVKSPSIFVKAVSIVRETVLKGGEAQMLRTQLSVNTRLVGLAELTVTESPLR